MVAMSVKLLRRLRGARYEIRQGYDAYPSQLYDLKYPPQTLYVIGNPSAIREGIAVCGDRRPSHYGLLCTRMFAHQAILKHIPIISGGSVGIEGAAHLCATVCNGVTVAFLGGGLECPFPKDNFVLFQQIIDGGGAVASAKPWNESADSRSLGQRNSLIAAMSKAVLVTEATERCGAFSIVDKAGRLGKEILAVPGPINSLTSRGSNRLISKGATPITDGESFSRTLNRLFPDVSEDIRKRLESATGMQEKAECLSLITEANEELLSALSEDALNLAQLKVIAKLYGVKDNYMEELREWLDEAQCAGVVVKNPDETYGASNRFRQVSV